MNKECKESIGKMMSLMERMDMNLTHDEASVHEENMICEATTAPANGQQKTAGKKVYAQLYLFKDDNNKVIRLYVEISELLDPTIQKIELTHQKDWGKTIGLGQVCQYGRGVIFYKDLSNKDWAYKQKNGTQQQTQPQIPKNLITNAIYQQMLAQATPSTIVSEQVDIKKMIAMATKSYLDEAANKIPFSSWGNLGATIAQQTGQASPASQSTQTGQPQTMTAPTPNNDSVKGWIDTYYKGVVDIIKMDAKFYDSALLDELCDLDAIYRKYLSLVPSDVEMLKDLSETEVYKMIIDSLQSNSGQWQSVITQGIPTINLKSEIFGHIISNRNIARIMSVVDREGIQKGSPDYPSLVLAASSWHTFFRRRVVANPKHKYPIMSPLTGFVTTKGFGTKAYAEALAQAAQTNPKSFRPVVGYDVTDTEMEDPNGEDYLQTKPGLLNNMEPDIMNQAAIDYINQMQSPCAQSANGKPILTQHQVQQMNNSMSVEGQAKVYNECLSDVIRSMRGPRIIDINGSSNPLHDYAYNTILASRWILQNKGNYTKKSTIDSLSFVMAYGLCTMTVGLNELQSMIPSQITKSKIEFEFKNQASTFVSNLRDIIKNMRNRVNMMVAPLRQAALSASSQGTSNQQLAAVVEENFMMENTIESLLNELNAL